jgi:hypothetical protein
VCDRDEEALQDAVLARKRLCGDIGFAIVEEHGARRNRRSGDPTAERTGCDLDARAIRRRLVFHALS